VLSGRVSEVYDDASEDVSALGLEEYRVHVKAELDASETALEGLPADSGAAAAEPPAGSDPAAAVSSPSLDGYGAELSFLLYETDALTLPVSAVFQKDHQYFVYVNQGGRAVIQPITVGYSTGSRVVVTEGLAEGDRVIDRINQEGLQEGIRVS
jgi:HlyD family secretion protein